MKNISIAFLLLYFFSSCGFFKSADELYNEAEKMRNENKPKVAIELFEKIVNRFSNHPKAPDAQYLIAEVYYRDLQDFTKSIIEHRKFLTSFPNSEKVPFSIFMQGYIYANELVNHDSASVLYRKFIDLYPDHEMLESVKFELKYLGLGINEIPELKHLIE